MCLTHDYLSSPFLGEVYYNSEMDSPRWVRDGVLQSHFHLRDQWPSKTLCCNKLDHQQWHKPALTKPTAVAIQLQARHSQTSVIEIHKTPASRLLGGRQPVKHCSEYRETHLSSRQGQGS